ncbi:hypothetical protein [Paenibacillus qinlingensis]|uniref:golvesin C-terminal-like domain-containing protein n=1 Tax=Paenibacillus qinlingensis TaxID=1837343 RepID=UPI001564503D|nr:hypothetical protein [Paenibacillus qinlingensis]NQX60825.1 hypothetical protein [Paenibacillus qinlingensis]
MQIITGEKQHIQVGRLIVLAFISFLLLWVAIPAKTWADDPLPDAALRDVLGENDIVVDNTDTAVTRTGTWSTGTSNPGKYFGSNYEFVNGGTGQVQTIKYTPSVPQTGVYEVFMVFSSSSNRADNVTVQVSHQGGVATQTVNQEKNGAVWYPLGQYTFTAGSSGYIQINVAGANGYVIADAIRLAVPVPDPVDPGPLAVNEPLGPVIFRSGFEAGSVGVTDPSDTGTITRITGTDTSVSAPNDWTTHLNGYSKFGDLVFEGHSGGDTSTSRFAKIVADPTPGGSGNKVLQYWLGNSGGSADRGRVQALLKNNTNLTEVFYKYRMYLHPDIELVKQSVDPNGWFTLAEFWNQPSWTSGAQYPFRMSLNLTKDLGVGKPFKLRISGQTTPTSSEDDTTQFVTVWEERNDWNVPTGVWLNMEVYYKQGDANSGRFYLAITPEGGEKRVVFDVTNWTYHPQNPAPEGLTHFHPLKLYTSRTLTNFVKDHGGALQILWDDLEFWPSMSPDAALRNAVGPNDIVVDNTSAGAVKTGIWSSGNGNPGKFYGSDYNFVNNGTGQTATYSPVISTSGMYRVYATFIGSSNRSNSVPYTIFHNGVTSTVSVNQRITSYHKMWYPLGDYYFSSGTGNYVQINSAGTSGYVMADAIRLEPL